MNIKDIFLNNVGPQYAEELLGMYQAAKNNRAGWEGKWAEIKRLLYPAPEAYGDRVGGVGISPPGGIDNHCSIVVAKINRIVSMLCALIADPASDWFSLEYVDFELGAGKFLKDSLEANKWLKSIANLLMNLFNSPESGFYPSLYGFIYGWYTYGTSHEEAMLRDDGSIRFDCLRVEDCAIAVNGHNEISEVYRTLSLTARQAFDLYGVGISPDLQREAQNSRTGNGRHEFFEANIPNPLAAVNSEVPMLPYISVVVETSGRKVVSVRQYPKMPYVTARFDLAPSDLYGRSYVWDALPDIKIINELNRLAITSIKYAVEPPMLTTPEVFKMASRIAPREILPWIEGGGMSPIAPLQFGTNPQILMEFYQYKVNELDETLAARDLFSQEMPSKTAFEVNERKIQLHNRLRSMVVRLEKECLAPLINLVTLLLGNAVPPFPYVAVAEEFGFDPLQLLQQLPAPIYQLKITFCGQLAKMRMLEEANNAERFLQFAAQAQQLYGPALDRIDMDRNIKRAAELFLNDEKSINSDKKVAEIAQARQEQQQLQERKMSADVALEEAEARKISAETDKIMQEAS